MSVSTLILMLAVVFHAPVIAQATAPLAGEAAALAQVNRLYLKEVELPGDLPSEFVEKVRRLNRYLKEELEHRGFSIVVSVERAEAVLRGEGFMWIVEDGSSLDPKRYTYEYRLTTLDDQQLWRTKFNIYSFSSWAKVDRKAAGMIARRLFKARCQSAKKAGVALQQGC